MFWLSLIFLLHIVGAREHRGVPALRADNESAPFRVRRFVHRHSCAGIDGSDNVAEDSIGCAEENTVQFEHVLTPTMLWCNDRDCVSEFNSTFPVHSIRCSPFNCTVLLHCAEAFEQLKYASLLTLCGVVALVAIPSLLVFIDLTGIVERHKRRVLASKNR